MTQESNHITVKELIEALQELDPQAIIVMSRDEEGNGYSPLAGIDTNCIYIPASTWMGEVMLAELTDEAREMGFGDEDVYTGGDGMRAIVFVPVN